jgi:hypothetical protein
LVNYDLNYPDYLLNDGTYQDSLLLPRNGSNHVGGTGSWAGYGLVKILDGPTFPSDLLRIFLAVILFAKLAS